MKNVKPTTGVLVGCLILLSFNCARAQDWPQWRGLNRDAKVTGFNTPKTWPKELTEKWKVTVGDGVATPALVGDKLYVFSRQEGNEIIRCLDAANGKEIWQDKYETAAATGGARGFSGPRSSPTVVDGKVVTLGLRGILSCYEAASGKKLWRNNDFKESYPMFFTSSSPIVEDGLCIAQLGGRNNGAVVAYDLASGKEKWKLAGESPAYASPVLCTVGSTKMIIVETDKNIVGIGVTDGKLLWQTPFAGERRSYNASTPMVAGQTILFSGSGRGTKAVKIEKEGDGFAAKPVWSNTEASVKFNTPVLKDGLVYGLSERDNLFCLNAKTGKTAWTAPLGGDRGYGSIVDVGPVLLALTPRSQLVVFQPSDKEFKQVASYKVGKDTYAYPVVAGNRVFVKDRDALTLWTIE